MEIIHLPFEQTYTLDVYGQTIQITLYKTAEDGQVKFGINAPRQVKVNREEVYTRPLRKLQLRDEEHVPES